MPDRNTFVESLKDTHLYSVGAYFLDSNPPTQVIVLPRYSFRPNDEGKKQTDSVTCAWLVWLEDRQPRRMYFYGRGRSQAAAVLRGLAE